MIILNAKIDNYFPEIVRPKAANVGPQIGKTFNKAFKKGVKIAFGTDAGVQPHGTNWKEFVYMVKFGMSPIETIQSATINTARLLKIDSILGSIEVGKMADLVIWDGDPFSTFSKAEKVFIDGIETNLTTRSTRLRDRYTKNLDKPNNYRN